MKYTINPDIINIPLDKEFYCIINPTMCNGIKIINHQQFLFFTNVNKLEYQQLISNPRYDEKIILHFLKRLEDKQFITSNGIFTHPHSANQIRHVDFWIHITDECNLRCPYCSISTKKTQSKLGVNQISSLVSTIVSSVKKFNIIELTLRFSGGEPLLNFQAIEMIISSLKSHLPITCKLKCIILTNLSILPLEKIDFITCNNIHISVSLDGIKEYHDKTRADLGDNGTFDKVWNNINILKEHGVRIHILSVISNRNINGLPQFIDLLVRNNLSYRLSIVRGEDFDYTKALVIFSQIYRNIEKQIEQGYQFSSLHQLCNLKFLKPAARTCAASRSSFVVYTNGDLYSCAHLLGNKSNILGNIGNPDDLNNLLITSNHHKDQFEHECIKCKYRFVCTNGCPLYKVQPKSPACEFYKEIIPLIYRLLGMERLYKVKG